MLSLVLANRRAPEPHRVRENVFEKTILIPLPIFIVVALGYGSGRMKLLGNNRAATLNRFVTHVSLPPLPFGALASQPAGAVFSLQSVASLGVAAAVALPVFFIISLHHWPIG